MYEPSSRVRIHLRLDRVSARSGPTRRNSEQMEARSLVSTNSRRDHRSSFPSSRIISSALSRDYVIHLCIYVCIYSCVRADRRHTPIYRCVRRRRCITIIKTRTHTTRKPVPTLTPAGRRLWPKPCSPQLCVLVCVHVRTRKVLCGSYNATRVCVVCSFDFPAQYYNNRIFGREDDTQINIYTLPYNNIRR